MKALTKLVLTMMVVLTVSGVAFAEGSWEVLTDLAETPVLGEIKDVLVDSDGFLWVATKSEGLLLYDGMTWEGFDTADGLPSNNVSKLALGPDGAVWIRSSSKILRYEDNALEEITYNWGGAKFLEIDDTNTIWICSDDSILSIEGENRIEYDLKSTYSWDYFRVSAFAFDADGRPYVAIDYSLPDTNTMYNGLYYFDDGSWKDIPGPGADGSYGKAGIMHLHLSPEGEFWADTGNKLYRIDDGSWDIVEEDYKRFYYIHDSFGSLWSKALVAPSLHGVSRFDGEEWIDYSVDEGLPAGNISFFIAGHNGEMWVVSDNRLVKYTPEQIEEPVVLPDYDSGTWTEFPVEVDGSADNVVRDILVDNAGVTWASVDGTGLYRYDGESWELLDIEDGFNSTRPYCMALAPDASLWVGVVGGLYHYDGVVWEFHPSSELMFYPFSLTVDNDGIVWCGRMRGVTSFNGENWTSYSEDDGLPSGYLSSNAIFAGPDGRIYYSFQYYDTKSIYCFYFFDGERWNEIEGPRKDGSYDNYISKIYVSHDGEIMANAGYEHLRLNGNKWDVVMSVISKSNYISDTFGTLWASSVVNIFKYGVARFDGEEWKEYGDDYGLPLTDMYQIFEAGPNGEMWASNEKQIFHFVPKQIEEPVVLPDYDSGTWTEFPVELDGNPGIKVWDILVDNDGVTWATVVGTGLYRYDGDNWELLNSESGFKSKSPNSLALGPDGSLWVGVDGGLYHYDGESWSSHQAPSGFSFRPYCLTVDEKGIVWCGLSHGVFSFDGENWTYYTKDDGLPAEPADYLSIPISLTGSRDIFAAPDGRIYYSFSYYDTKSIECLYVFDGDRWNEIKGTMSDGSYDRGINRIYSTPEGDILATSGQYLMLLSDERWEVIRSDYSKYYYSYDSYGTLWASTSINGFQCGIARLDGEEWKVYGDDYGLQQSEFYRLLEAGPNGEMWAATMKQLYHFVPGTTGGPDIPITGSTDPIHVSKVVINEVVSLNSTLIKDADDDYSDWIELYNSGDTAVNLAGCGLSDRAGEPFKWTFPEVTIPAGGYLLVFASGKDKFDIHERHTSFKISSDGEAVVLTAPDGTTVDHVEAPAIPVDVSWGRVPDGGAEIAFFDAPTPGEANSATGGTEFAGDVTMSMPGGFYQGSVTVELTAETSDAEIRYTSDGSEPDKHSSLYSSPIAISETTVIRAREIGKGMLPGPIVTKTYFLGVNSTLPIFSLATEYMDDIYNGYAGKDEKPVHIEMYETDGSEAFALDGGMNLHGLIAYSLPQKALAFFARNRYGEGTIKHRMFPNIPVDEYKAFILRSSGNDIGRTFFMDGLVESLVEDIDLDTMGYRPSLVYVNGEYWGIHNLREKQNENYLAAHHDIDPDNVDMLEAVAYTDHPVVIEGDLDHYNVLLDYLENNNIAEAAHYEYIQTQMDVDNFIDYLTLEIYSSNWDWPFQNMKWWRPRTEDGRWRWIVYDLDTTFGQHVWEGKSYLERVADSEESMRTPLWSKYILVRLLENETFRNNFINRVADQLNTIYQPDVVIARIEDMASAIEPEMLSHIARWKDEDQGRQVIQSMTGWNDNVQKLKDFAIERPDTLRQNYMDLFALSGTSKLTLTSPSTGGSIKLNSLSLDSFPWSGSYFTDVPLTITARPDFGYRFVKWEGASSSSDASIELTLSSDTELTAVFEKTGNDIVIDISQSPFEVAGDLVISPEMSLTVEAGVELLMADDVNIIVQGTLNIQGSEDNPVVIHAANSSRWGAIVFDNAVGESTIQHALIRDASHGSDALLYPAAVSGVNSDFTVENVSFEENIQGILSTGGNITIRGCVFDSSNSDEPINIKDGWALVEGCCFYDVQEQDAIDFDGVSGGIIKGNQIYGSNDDGIDIGDGCTNILIVDNRISGCFDKAISIGEVSTDIRVERNVLSASGYGIAVKDNSTATIDHCTIFGNEFAIAGYEKGEDSSGGGTEIVTNSILAGSMISALMTDNLSAISISYSLADSELLPGEGNIQDDAAMMAPDYGGFMLTMDSPAIDSGDPGSEFDSDGSRSDMGALAYSTDNSSVVITEINYNPSSDFDSGDWLELFNGSGSTVHLNGWRFSDADDANIFSMPDGTVLDAGNYLVLCRENAKFSGLFPQVSNAVGEFYFALSNGGEALRLFDSEGVLQDFVVYDDEAPWPTGSDGSGATLTLKSPDLDNSLAENWGYSSGYGTPGAANAGDVGVDDAEPVAYSLGRNYPNPFNPTTTIPFTLSADSHVRLAVYSVLGQRVMTLVDERVSAGKHSVIFDADGLSSGIYIYRIEAGDYRETASMLLVK